MTGKPHINYKEQWSKKKALLFNQNSKYCEHQGYRKQEVPGAKAYLVVWCSQCDLPCKASNCPRKADIVSMKKLK